MNETKIAEKEAAKDAATELMIENCPHTNFNGGYQKRCEGCGHTSDYIFGYQAGSQAGTSAPEGESLELDDALDAAKKSAKKLWKQTDFGFADIVEHGFRAGLAAARPVWVAIEDGLPKDGNEDDEYLIRRVGGTIVIRALWQLRLDYDCYTHYQKITPPGQPTGRNEK